MKILHIASDYRYTPVYTKLFEKMKLGFDLRVMVPTRDEVQEPKIWEGDKEIVSAVPLGSPRTFGIQINSRKIARYIIDNNYCEGVNLIHAHYALSDGSVALQIKSQVKIPYVISMRATCLENLERRKAIHNYITELNVLVKSSAIFLQSRAALDRLRRNIPAFMRDKLEGKYYIIPNGIDDFWLKNLSPSFKFAPKKECRIITVASIEGNKNILAVAKATERLNKIGIVAKHIVVGKLIDASIEVELQKIPYSTYIGERNKEELLGLYRSADIFVMVSHSETFGLVYAEALTQGLPVIYSKGQGFDGQFDEGIVGYHATSSSIDEIVDAVVRILERYQDISANALLMSGRFDWRIIAGQYNEIYSGLIMKSSQNPAGLQ